MAGVYDALFGTKGRVHQAQTLNPQQNMLQQNLIGGLQGGQSNIPGFGYLQNLLSGNPEAFSAYEAPALRQFHQQIVPGLAERFAGLGMGAQGSSAFQQQLASAGGRLSQDLAAQRAGLQQGALGQLQGFYGQAMQPSFQNFYQQPTQGALHGLASGLGQGIGYGASGMFGGGFGGLSGILSQLFGGMGGGGGGNSFANIPGSGWAGQIGSLS